MKHKRRSKSWWQATIAKWRRSGVSAETFAKGEGIKATTLRWWSYELGRDSRAKHGSSAILPIEIAMPTPRAVSSDATKIELAWGKSVVRFNTGTDVTYVAALMRALG